MSKHQKRFSCGKKVEGTLFSYFKPKQQSMNVLKTDVTPGTDESEGLNESSSTNGHAPCTKKKSKRTVSTDPMHVTLSPRMPPDVLESDSEGEIGVRKNLSGRPKRRASMTISERQRAQKRSRRMIDSDSSEEEYKPGSEDDESEEETSEESEEIEKMEDSDEEEMLITPKKKCKVKVPVATPTSKSKMLSTSKSPHTTAFPISPAVISKTTSLCTETGKFLHETLNWLKEENRCDKTGCHCTDVTYNPKTLQVPGDFLKKQTPAMKQWWTIKSENFDTILFFKVGKFYELYHMDAVVGVQELGLVFMKGSYAHCGFPEIAFSRYAQTLVQKDYKVARVEQTETPQMMEERIKNMIRSPSRCDRVVKREVCAHVSKGTRTMGFYEGVDIEPQSSFLLALKEKQPHSGMEGELEFGVCFVDTCIGIFYLGQFTDDRQCSRLRTLLAHYPPAQILYERGNLSHQVFHIINKKMASVMKDSLIPDTEFWTSKHTLKVLVEGGYFLHNQEQEVENLKKVEVLWPEVLRRVIEKGDSQAICVTSYADLTVSTLGACLWCLRRSFIDKELLQMKNFVWYEPPDVTLSQDIMCMDSADLCQKRMVLDDVTLVNLDVVDPTGRSTCTLLNRLNNCSTAFGKRLLRQWLCAPLFNPTAINERLDAVTVLIDNPSIVSSVVSVLKTLPDLQRLLRRILTVGSKTRCDDHPDSRAVLYEETTYSKRKIIDFLSVLEGFTCALKVINIFETLLEAKLCSSKLLRLLVTTTDNNGQFPNISHTLQFFNQAFDHNKARKDGIILPHKGVNKEYDQALEDISHVDQLLENYLNQQRKLFACKAIVYWGSGRNRYQLEVPDSVLTQRKHIPDYYELKSQRKGFRRYWTKETESLLEEMMNAEERKHNALRHTMQDIFHSFAQHFQMWESAVNCLATLDVLIAMATYSRSDMCRPSITFPSLEQGELIDIRSGRHPCVTLAGNEFIPNDVFISSNKASVRGASCVVVTGPNMGGKSTLLRQTGLIVILAQMGCYVPAESCVLTPVDRIFTRLGASDRIMQGESTFYVELSETCVILKHATKTSLVLLDELGRGTATYDGTAIASAVVHELAYRCGCRTLFSTHYHSLVDDFASESVFSLGHMACMLESDEEEGEEAITFLYKFVNGACSKSYGFNVGRLAGLSQQLVAEAKKRAGEYEASILKLQLFRSLVASQKMGTVRSLYDQLSSVSFNRCNYD